VEERIELVLSGTGRSAAEDGGRRLVASSAELTELRYLASPSRVTFRELAEDLSYLDGLKLKYVGDSTLPHNH
jgi:hypothetical protein